MRWLAHERVFSPDVDDYIELPVGELCESDGASVECYVPMALAEVQEKLLQNASLRKVYTLVKQVVKSGLALNLAKDEHLTKEAAADNQDQATIGIRDQQFV